MPTLVLHWWEGSAQDSQQRGDASCSVLGALVPCPQEVRR